MTYQDTINWLFSRLPMYQNQGKSAYKIDLSNTLLLANHLDNPEDHFKTVHIAGTNGKGSTSHMLASVLQEAGYKVGLYTSPHLKDFRERIKINGKEIDEDYVVQFVDRNTSFFESNALSFFEMTVGLAFQYFAEKDVDIAIIEVGLGGRLDSTNIISPELSVITNIGLDHTQFLGNSLHAIAKEKGGIIKQNTPVVIGETQDEIKAVFKAIAEEQQASITFADSFKTKTYRSDLMGSYQVKNIKTVVECVKQLQNKGFHISEGALNQGLLSVVKNTGLLGRWQILQLQPKVICDTAHNTAGLTYTITQLLEEPHNAMHIVFGVVNDKDLSTIVDLLPKQATYYFCKPNIPRGYNAKDLKIDLNAHGCKGESYNSVNEAYITALQNADTTDVIYVGGSTFVVAEII
ncbi:bifunctional folylpolyglutamate synthase/dihydrofolate synthase [Bizionia gelidisalsuginis]|uniref:Dihydrofolate synthase/folylpolyglutamate synthase n=1 Tax=Bizionia gelidisalsuginis TaxID=291188 RepID=A0ABY3MCX8_9FLAO|nr:folylpolyglutamate synthase/dihydrofolate synthase family protein [Bizionia gelidisalsuginis]TYC16183.1 bifunctional folylpolyglutamate synthase/dihydrofolate synthase [Bizionia gelidisalsuginis]